MSGSVHTPYETSGMPEQSGEEIPRTGLEVAVVGMAARFPGADDLHAFWRNLRDGVESIAFFTREQLREAGGDPAVIEHPGLVPAMGELRGADEVDAPLLGLTPRDAEVLDPQHRVLLECAWAALEHAGCDPARLGRPVGVFAGSSASGYVHRLEANPALVRAVGSTRVGLWNEKDQLAAGISYRLDLRGPSLSVQTACSTSLVAVHLACQSLLNGECDLALAGGVSVQVPLRRGYVFSPDGILSPDGRVRAFDAEARGTVGGNGAGLVALKRLDDALADGDTIHAVIRGSAINNDGAQKVGYTAPSVTGQARVIAEALSVAGVDAGTLQYVEGHGSGTPLGDAIELKAMGQVLTRAGAGHPCAIGSVKTNLGHLDTAAGIAGLIKTVLAMENREIPPSLNCAAPHPEIEAQGGRIFVNTALRPWERNGTPRRAGVSSFGIGGTNAHVVLEEAPPREPSGPSRELQLLVVSARTPSALEAAAERLAAHLETEAPPLADAAFTLQHGRRELEHRLAVVCRDAREGAARLRAAAARASAPVPGAGRPVAFLFPGLGMHHVDMARGLYDAEPVFRRAVDECCELLRPELGSDLREVLYAAVPGGPGDLPAAPAAPDGEGKRGEWDLRALLGRGAEPRTATPLDDTRFAQPAVFVTEYALARLWTSWGVRPQALLGHSLGEYVAACIAGVLRLDDALRLVALRARLIDAVPEGAMLAVPLGEDALHEILPAALDIAAVNTPQSCVVSGAAGDVEAFEALLAGQGTVSRRLPTRHAFHSRAMAPVAAELERLIATFTLRAPEIPFVSNVTGTWIGDEEARSPGYWARHLTQAVRFSDGVATLREEPGWALLEVGPGQTLGAWALQHPAGGAAGGVVFSSLRHPHNRVPDLRFLLDTLGEAWAAGVAVDWAGFGDGERRHRIPLPGYPFERKRYWVDAPRTAASPIETDGAEPRGVERADDRDETAGWRADGVRAGAASVAGAAEGGSAHTKGPDVMENRIAEEIRQVAPSPRYEAILARLKEIAAELTGIGQAEVETELDLFQAGFDSLLLLQAIQAIEKWIGVRLSLVEMLEEMASLGAIARHIDAVLPAGAGASGGAHPPADPTAQGETAASLPAGPSLAAPAEPARTVAAPPAFFPPPAFAAPGDPRGGEGAMERVFAHQLQAMTELMAQQIAALRANGAAPDGPGQTNGAASNGQGHTHDVSSNGHGHTNGATSSGGARTNGAASNGHAHDAPSNGHGHAADPSMPPRIAAAAVPQSPRARIQPPTFVAYQPLNTEAPGGMTAEQREYLDAFIARFVERTKGSKAHQARWHLPLADTRVTARFRRAWKEITYPIVGERALGSRVWDVDGNEYVDTGMSFGCNLFGHAPPFVTRAIHGQVERGYGLGPQSKDAGRAAELVCRLGGNERAVFCNSGTEAVLGAIRAARAFTGRTRIAYFAGSYHGWSDVVQGRLFTAGGRREVRPTAPGVPPLPLGDVLMLDFDEPASLDLLARHAHEIALVMVEPVQSRRPDLQPFAFLRELRRITREAGALLLFDELITGFRMGPGGAQAFFGIDADLVTYGKIVAGGLPMGAVAGKREPMNVFDGGVWSYGDDSYPPAQRTLFAGAFWKHPISMAVAVSVLEEIERRGQPMYDRLNEKTARLVERMNAFFDAGGYPVTAAHFASCFRFFFADEVKFPDLFNHHLVMEGVYVIPETGTHFLSTAHTDEDLEQVFRAVRASAEAMRAGGFLPPSPAGAPTAGGEMSRNEAAWAAAAAKSSTVVSDASPASASSLSADPSPASAAPRVDERGVRAIPLTEGQRQLWVESQMGEDANRAYIESTSVRLRGALHVDALRAALQALVDRHDTLRATFSIDGDVQLVHPALRVEVPLADFRGEPAERRVAAVEAWIRRTVRQPFDLVRGPLVRFALAAVGHDEHLLLFDSHHAVMDGWSFGVVWRELGALYAAAREGRHAELPPVADHAGLVRAQLAAVREDAAAQAFWEAQFAGGVPVLELPTDRPRPAVRSYRGERLTRVMGGDLLDRLAEAGRGHGLTLFNTLLSAFMVWLGRLSGDDDVVVGTPSAGQAGRGAATELVGYGINILPIRARLSPEAPFVEHARRVRRSLLGALEHQNFSFPKLVETLLRTRDTSRPPVFSALLSLDRAPGEAALGDLRAGFETEFGGGAKVDITFDLAETDHELRLRCAYAADLFDAATIERWLDAFERLVDGVARDPQTRIADLALIGPGERRLVVEEWNRTGHPYPHVCIHELFEEQARRTPGAVAVVSAGDSLTYAQLDARANQLAHHLRGRGVGVEDRVALCLERAPELLVAFFAVLKAGAAYVPLDPAHPAERLGYMLRDSGARLLLTQSWLEPRLPGTRPATLALDALGQELEREPGARPESGVRPENLAYVYYTSGSTGRPKGVAVHHYGPANYFAWGRQAYRAGDGRGAPVFSSMAVDLTLSNFIPLFAGERVELLPEGPGVEPLAEAIRRSPGYAMIKITPTHLALLNQALSPAEAAASTATLVVGADNLVAEPTLFWQRHAPGVRLLNEYGPTETVVGCSLYEIPPGRHEEGRIPIGRPIQNLTHYVLDARMQPVPVGVPGELCIGGVGVARGYLGRPALTAEKFVPDPFGAPGARLYRTGDRARFLAGGDLEFLGRIDFQVKIRGYRIEPGEVEGALVALPGVRHALAAAREDRPGDRRLVAYVVAADPAAPPTAAELRDGLRKTLPEHMLPSAFVFLDALPVGSTGKVERAALPAPETADAGEAYLAPRTPVEETLAGIWAEVLGARRVGTRENFFELGGHSLLATRVVSRVRRAFGVELPLRAVFEAPTVGGLAERVEALWRAELPQLPPVAPAGRSRPLPLSFAQERLWFLDRMQPHSAFYNIPVPLRLEGPLDTAALERALGEIVRRHEALRTTLREVDGVAVQVIAPAGSFTLAMDDLSALEPGAREAEVRRREAAEAARPFDLSAGPLFRAGLLRLAAGHHVLLLCVHHVVSDGWSMGVFFRELSALYAAYRGGGASPLPELAVQYADHAVWQREQLRGATLERHLSWWKERLAGAPALLELPTDHPRPAVQSYRGACEPVHLSVELRERLSALARGEGATLFMVLLGAFQVLLSKYAGSDDVVVGTTIAGRTRGEVEPLIGLFMNTLVLRTGLSGDPGFREVLRRVREVTLGAYEHQELPFEKLVAELQPERTLSHSPVFQALFELQDTGAPAPELSGVRVSDVEGEVEATKFDLALGLAATARGVVGALTYSADLFEPATARRMVRHLERVLEQVVDDPDRRLSRLELVDAEERARLEAWNRTAAEFPAGRCIHQLFEAQARETPEAMAVVFGGQSLTFAELDARANRLAHHLAGRGVGPEVRVGICLERGLELMVSILGVMKAGGAYVPADPSHPAERIGYVLADSAVAVVLTQERLRARVPVPAGVEVLSVDTGTGLEPVQAGNAEPPASGVGPWNLAYVIYTSGSTGRPKGVAMHHRGVCNYIDWGVRFYGAGQGNGAPVFSSMAVDLTITNLLPLFAGRPVRLLPEESPVEALAATLREAPGFGLIKITPVHLSLLTPLLSPDEARGVAHTLVVGADALSAETTLFWQEHAPGVRLMNEYGPTETVVGCSAYLLPPGLHRSGPVPVGGPIQNLTFHVLDVHQRPVPVGLPGELYIGGAGVARGYLGRPGLTAEKFVPDPFAGPGARMYRTGDRARWQGDGNLLVLGRTDGQLKVRGFRVEPGEVEAALLQCPGVLQCRVVAREDRPGDRRLVAYLVGHADAEELRAYLRRSLPEYMVPSAFVPLAALPQTATGKLDLASLPAPGYGAAGVEADEPRNYVEAQLLQLWEELLGVEGIGPTQSFFELGGNSLLALRLFTQAKRLLGCDLPVATLFAGATVRHMANAVLEQRRAAAAPDASVVPLQPGGSLPPLFLVHSADRNVMGYVNLVRHLGADQPVYGVRDVGDDLARPVERIAAEHVAAIRAVQPRGPYYLASWSFGGMVAFEMALQLEHEGEGVAFVGLLDTMSPRLIEEWSWRRDAEVVAGLAREVAEGERRPFVLEIDELEGMEVDDQIRHAAQALRAQGAAPADFDAAALAEQWQIVRDRVVSCTGYVAGRFSGAITLYRADEVTQRHHEFFAHRRHEQHALGWSPLAEVVEVCPVPGSHVTLASEPHVRVLAQRMRESLEAARERAAAGHPSSRSAPPRARQGGGVLELAR